MSGCGGDRLWNASAPNPSRILDGEIVVHFDQIQKFERDYFYSWTALVHTRCIVSDCLTHGFAQCFERPFGRNRTGNTV